MLLTHLNYCFERTSIQDILARLCSKFPKDGNGGGREDLTFIREKDRNQMSSSVYSLRREEKRDFGLDCS